MTEAFSRYALSNPLHPDCFPYLRKMESEIVAMTVKLFNGDPRTGHCGTMTSGGTESILMACKAYRDLARSKRGVREPELVVPLTAHAAFDKACAYFGIKLVHVPVDPVTFRANPAAMRRAITPNTIGLICSAPSYPQGVIDPVEELAALALEHGLPLHVDCCLGSYCVAFAGRAGFAVPPFDFAVKGVSSISCDTHKYGFAPKGSSVVMYASEELRHAQYFVAPEWTGGIYASPSIAGSRPGALIAACWATLMAIGAEGYTESARTILSAARRIEAGVRTIDHLCVFGKPDLSVVCFGPRPGDRINIYNVGDAMTARGWNLNTMQNPPCIHICVTFANAGSVDRFLADLADAVADVVSAPPGKFKDGSGAIYGMAAAIPDKSLVSQVAFGFLDALYRAEPPK
jgi:sphinganine-1-phosphate aldolase